MKIHCFEEQALRYLMKILWELRQWRAEEEGKRLSYKDCEAMQREITDNLPTPEDLKWEEKNEGREK